MKLPVYYFKKKYPLYELIGVGIILLQLIVTLTQKYVHYDWITDTLWLAAGFLLSWSEWQKENQVSKLPPKISTNEMQLLFGLYLFLYHLLAAILTLKYGGLRFLLYLAGASVYTIALFFRAKESGIQLNLFNWKNLLRFPGWPISLALVFCMLGMFLPMIKSNMISSYYGLQFGYSAYSGWGYNNWGYNFYNTTILVKGYMAPLGMFICLVIAFLLVFHILKTAAGKTYPIADIAFKIAVPALLLWWLIGAKGFESLKGFGNILFIIGLLSLAFAVYFPQKLAELVKEKGIIK